MNDRLRHFLRPCSRGRRGEFHHRDAEATKLREANETGASDVANRLDGRSALRTISTAFRWRPVETRKKVGRNKIPIILVDFSWLPIIYWRCNPQK
jgi:hypothetical protein